jgi:hypothetical protein
MPSSLASALYTWWWGSSCALALSSERRADAEGLHAFPALLWNNSLKAAFGGAGLSPQCPSLSACWTMMVPAPWTWGKMSETHLLGPAPQQCRGGPLSLRHSMPSLRLLSAAYHLYAHNSTHPYVTLSLRS